MKQTVRIIGGQCRGKTLSFPDIEGLRPTPDRVRETLFNWLMNDIKGTCCLDLFAGSGALGFEAWSRGATHITLLEHSQIVCRYLQKAIMQFNSPDITLIHTNAVTFLQQTKEQFDIIFLDPPFKSSLIEQCLPVIASSDILSPEGLIYIESASRLALDNEIWQEVKLKPAGHVWYGLYKKHQYDL